MVDLVVWLNKEADATCNDIPYSTKLYEAADEIERLRAENERIKQANIDGKAWVDAVSIDIKALTSERDELQRLRSLCLRLHKQGAGDG